MNDRNATADVTPIEDLGQPKATPRFARIAARSLMGLLFLVTGLNAVLPFLPPPDALPAGAQDMTVAFAKSGYLLPLLGATQALVGVLLLSGRFVPLALTVIAPVIVNIVAFHAFLAPQGLPVAIVVLALEIYLVIAHRQAFRGVLAARSA